MKKFAENMIVCGTAFALLVALTASNVHAQNNTIYRAEPLKFNPVQVSNAWNAPQKIMPQPVQLPQQRLVAAPTKTPTIVPATAVMPMASHAKPAMVVMPNHQPNHHPMTPAVPVKHVAPIHAAPIVTQPVVPANRIPVNPPHIWPEPQKTVIIVQPPKKSLLEKLFDKIF